MEEGRESLGLYVWVRFLSLSLCLSRIDNREIGQKEKKKERRVFFVVYAA